MHLRTSCRSHRALIQIQIIATMVVAKTKAFFFALVAVSLLLGVTRVTTRAPATRRTDAQESIPAQDVVFVVVSVLAECYTFNHIWKWCRQMVFNRGSDEKCTRCNQPEEDHYNHSNGNNYCFLQQFSPFGGDDPKECGVCGKHRDDHLNGDEMHGPPDAMRGRYCYEQIVPGFTPGSDGKCARCNLAQEDHKIPWDNNGDHPGYCPISRILGRKGGFDEETKSPILNGDWTRDWERLPRTALGLFFVDISFTLAKLFPGPKYFCDSWSCREVTHVCVMTLCSSFASYWEIQLLGAMMQEIDSKLPVLLKIVQYSMNLAYVLSEAATEEPAGAGTKVLIAFAALVEIYLILKEALLFFDFKLRTVRAAENPINEAVMMNESAPSGASHVTSPVTPPSPLPPPVPATSATFGGGQPAVISMSHTVPTATVSSTLTFGEFGGSGFAGGQSSNGVFSGGDFAGGQSSNGGFGVGGFGGQQSSKGGFGGGGW